MPNIGPLEIGVVLIIALVILGTQRFPEHARSIGSGLREFKDSIGGTKAEPRPLEGAVAPDESGPPA